MRRRLQQAALELFRERGYERTTAAEIAARAGVTERTFFRHFPDKREALFGGEAEFHAALDAGVAAAPAALGPMEVVFWALRSVETVFEENRAFVEPRQKVIAATPALRERELAKAASTISGLASALERRGVEAKLANLAAQTGMAVFGHAARAWLEDPSFSLESHLERAFQTLRGLSGANSPARR
ncbi:MAG: TetR/AcrR family transcriptional regulator [Caulobacteraceae bacterium]